MIGSYLLFLRPQIVERAVERVRARIPRLLSWSG